ncbi:hypothetical protein LMG28138_04347 [Pararobbsia alpina]|uniref:Uncharacterized protein n=2 Tax=Pararobbsia alpina TaxID=621374 RepID=A0A6S7BP65_9BURK|nr:hypothetical protein LMG28138_04347 [Pararobbsia alpina]
MLGVSTYVVRRLVAAGFVRPRLGRNARDPRFSFGDIAMLRTAHSLREAGVPPGKIVRALQRMRDQWVADAPLTAMRVTAVGREVAVRRHDQAWLAESGQLLFEFEPKPAYASPVTSINRMLTGAGGTIAQTEPDDATTFFRRGVDLERKGDPYAAERAYRAAIAAASDHIDAALNLGCLLCDGARYVEAAQIYRLTIERAPDQPVLHYNLGVALEDGGDVRGALAAYDACLSLSPDFADAHFNAARLHEQLGDVTRAIRHFNTYRALRRNR